MYYLDSEKNKGETLEFKSFAEACFFAEEHTPNCRAGLYFNSVTFFNDKTCEIFFFLYRDDHSKIKSKPKE